MPEMPRLAAWLRMWADRIDDNGAIKRAGVSFTFERGKGQVVRTDGKGCPLYFIQSDYERAHDEADSSQPDPHIGDAFAEAIDQLIADLAEWADTFSKAGMEGKAEIIRALALPWLRKEAAQHRATTARQQFLASAQASAGLVGPSQPITMAELARNLYTDRGNLTRAINRALRER